jgi:hypothetical protein
MPIVAAKKTLHCLLTVKHFFQLLSLRLLSSYSFCIIIEENIILECLNVAKIFVS